MRYNSDIRSETDMSACNICPRMCGADRKSGEVGFCNSPYDFRISKYMLHIWEEPCICTGAGAGTVFFSGCNLGCIYCQNMKISRGGTGELYDASGLERIIFDLLDLGAGSIEFVTPTHYTDRLAELLRRIKPRISVPVVWNSGGYERVESLRMLEGLVDIYLPDIKYYSADLSEKYSSAPDYWDFALPAIEEMVRQTGKPAFDGNILQKGTIMRHLVLPGCRMDSVRILDLIADRIGAQNILLSLMSQYTPDFYAGICCQNSCNKLPEYKNLLRRVTSFEYNSVLKHAQDLKFEGYFQSSSSADSKYTPEF